MSNEQLLGQETEEYGQVFPAAEFVTAREQQGLSVDDVARELKLSGKYIESLERGAFDELPSMVFARGYVQSYSKLLNLDVSRYLALFDNLYGSTSAGNAPQFRTTSGAQSTAKLGDPVIKWSAWIFVLAIVAATVWWWKIQQGADPAISLSPATESVEVESVDGSTLIVPSGLAHGNDNQTAPQPEINLVASDGTELTADAANSEVPEADSAETSSDASIDSSVETQAEAEVQQEEAPQPVIGTDVSLRITFTDECWVSVEDHTGKVLEMRVKPGGSELNVSGEAPLKLLLGRVEAVGNVFLNGSAVEFNRGSRSGVVRLTLPQSE
ncbi:helix-turn-helix domain-containing protein [Amphritea opalescens]|uniref:Helix-turn-helix domain-containing protein n=1 Tax=Amphritea opalescens TaxID=2490544 RepID=A0A430KSU7_9GAMM|nr:RodZ domain-containing protein [Amphritea opalescens]RTE66528.1 helix-turn-helix domain-containing protein [Amphritea opalescens]